MTGENNDVPGYGPMPDMPAHGQRSPGADSLASTAHSNTGINGTSTDIDEPFVDEWLSVAEAVSYCAAKGLSRNIKTVRRWAHRSFVHPESAEVLARKQDTDTDFRYVIERTSLDVKIAQELEFESNRTPRDKKGHDLPGPGTPSSKNAQNNEETLHRAEPDSPAHGRTGSPMSDDAQIGSGVDDTNLKRGDGQIDEPFYHRQIDEKNRQIGKLHKQLERRDDQIMAMLERDRETNILIKGLQEALLPASSTEQSQARRLAVKSWNEGDNREGKNGEDAV